MLKPQYEAQKLQIFAKFPNHNHSAMGIQLLNPNSGTKHKQTQPCIFPKKPHIYVIPENVNAQSTVRGTETLHLQKLSSRSLPIAHTFSLFQKLIHLVEILWGQCRNPNH